MQVKDIAKWRTGDVEQIFSTYANAIRQDAVPVLLLSERTPLFPSPGLAGGLGENVINLIKSGRIIVSRY